MDIYTILFTIYFKYVTHLILFRKRLTVIYFNVINSTRHLVEKKTISNVLEFLKNVQEVVFTGLINRFIWFFIIRNYDYQNQLN